MAFVQRAQESSSVRFEIIEGKQEDRCVLCPPVKGALNHWVAHVSEDFHSVTKTHLHCLANHFSPLPARERSCFHCHRLVNLEPTDSLTQEIARSFIRAVGEPPQQFSLRCLEVSWQNAIARCDEMGFLTLFTKIDDPLLRKHCLQQAALDPMTRGKFLIALYKAAKEHPEIQKEIVYNRCFKANFEELTEFTNQIDVTPYSELFLHPLARILLEKRVQDCVWDPAYLLISFLREEEQIQAKSQVLGLLAFLQREDLLQVAERKWPGIQRDKEYGEKGWKILLERACRVPPSVYSYPKEICSEEVKKISLSRPLVLCKGGSDIPMLLPLCDSLKKRERAIHFLGGENARVFLLTSLESQLKERYKQSQSAEVPCYINIIKTSIAMALLVAGLTAWQHRKIR